MADAVTIHRVTTRRHRQRFIRLPFHLYRGDPNWVPPLIASVKSTLSPDHPFFQHAAMELFLAARAGRVVGRIAAILNAGYNEYAGERVAFFGFFESIDDPTVAQALFDTARRFGRERGLGELRGPTSPSMHAECGLLVEGFDGPPCVMMPYNPPFYAALVEHCGLTKCKDLYAYQIRREDIDGPQSPRARLEQFERRIRKRFPGLRIRPIDMRRFFEEARALGSVFNEARERNFGYAPMNDGELNRLAKDLRPVARPDLCLAAELDGELVGAGLALPDVNVVLKRLRGRLLPFGLFTLMRQLPKVHRIRVFGIAAKPEHRHKGVAGLLLLEIMRRAYDAGCTEAEASWVSEDNVMSNRTIMALVCARQYRTYRIYSQPL